MQYLKKHDRAWTSGKHQMRAEPAFRIWCKIFHSTLVWFRNCSGWTNLDCSLDQALCSHLFQVSHHCHAKTTTSQSFVARAHQIASTVDLQSNIASVSNTMRGANAIPKQIQPHKTPWSLPVLQSYPAASWNRKEFSNLSKEVPLLVMFLLTSSLLWLP